MDDELPKAISGTLRTYSLLRDSTLRIVIDIDPRFKAGFHRLFPDNDTPVAVAPLALNFERIEEEEKQKGGPLCRLACIWCKDKDFWEWLYEHYGQGVPVENEDEAAELLRAICEVNSRSELDHDPAGAARFHNIVRNPFIEWSKNK